MKRISDEEIKDLFEFEIGVEEAFAAQTAAQAQLESCKKEAKAEYEGGYADGQDWDAFEAGKEFAQEKVRKEQGYVEGFDAAESTMIPRATEDGRQAGIREVVEWIRENATESIAIKDSDTSQEMNIRAIPDGLWQAKLKEWE